MTISDVASMIVALATMGSLIYISRQVSVTRQTTKGQFLLALDERLQRSNPILMRLLNEPNFTPAGTEWGDVWTMMTIFERINVMVDDRILDVGLVDRLYGFMLMTILANDAIYHRLKSSGAEWQDFIDLCHLIADHRAQTLSANAFDIDKAFIERVSKLNKETRRLRNPFSF